MGPPLQLTQLPAHKDPKSQQEVPPKQQNWLMALAWPNPGSCGLLGNESAILKVFPPSPSFPVYQISRTFEEIWGNSFIIELKQSERSFRN